MAGMDNSSGAKIRVTTDVLIARASDAERKIAGMENRLNNIQRIVNATRSYWVGDAGDTCRRRYDNGQADIQEIMKRLKAQPGTLLTIANVYREAEQTGMASSNPLPGNVIE